MTAAKGNAQSFDGVERRGLMFVLSSPSVPARPRCRGF
jgi:hypothetical protein